MSGTDQLHIDFSAKGHSFHQDASLPDAISLLQSLERITDSSFNSALSDYMPKKSNYTIKQQIRIKDIKISSLIGTIYTYIPPSAGLVAPYINSQTWDYIIGTFEFLKILKNIYIKNNNTPPTIIINNPSAPCIIAVNGSTVNVNGHILANSKKLASPIGDLSDIIETGSASHISISSNIHSANQKQIFLTRDNAIDYDIRNISHETSAPNSFYCKIYRLNTKERNGLLDIYESPDNTKDCARSSFSIDGGSITPYIEAMMHEYSRANGIITYKQNLLGERHIDSVSIATIENIGPRTT